MTATKTRGPELPLDTAPVGAVVRSGAPPTGIRTDVRELTQGTESIQRLLTLAIEKGSGVEALEKLVDLHERVTKREAALEFARALAEFQAECPAIGKNKTAEIPTRGGGKYSYQYAPLDTIVRTVKPLLIARGFSYGWDSKVEGGALTCMCTLRHVNGHSESASFTLPVENASAMSPQQKVGAALTFAQRKTLESVLGLNTTEEDTDGVAREIDPTPIDDDQLAHLEDMLKETKTKVERFLKHFGIAKVADLPASQYKEAINVLEQRRERRAAQ